MIFLKNYTIKSKIKILALLATVIILMMTFVAYGFANYLKSNFVAMETKELQIKNISNSLKNDISNLHNYILTHSLLKEQQTLEKKVIDDLNQKILKDFENIHIIMVSTNDKKLLETLEKLNIRYRSYYAMAKDLPVQFSADFEDGIDNLLGINAISNKMFEELDLFILKSNENLNERFFEINKNMSNMIIVFFLVSFISLLIFLLLGYILQHTILISLQNLSNGIDGFFKFLSQKTTKVNDIEIVYNDELGKISAKINDNIHEAELLIDNERRFAENLERRVAEEVKKNIQKEQLLFEQSKMASLGEMIGNIAHQWRQPLSSISTYATGILFKKEYGILTDEDLILSCEKITQNTQRLSEIITTFRNYLMETKEVKDVVLQDTISQSLEIIDITLVDNGIKLKKNIQVEEPIIIKMVAGELSEVIINIINNGKDILLENNVENPWIEVEFFKFENNAVITIEDNGGGVPLEVMPKIFDQHFTTKDKAHGTGIGLYMSYQIITESLQGKLYVENTQNGAKFFIEIPLVLDEAINED